MRKHFCSWFKNLVLLYSVVMLKKQKKPVNPGIPFHLYIFGQMQAFHYFCDLSVLFLMKSEDFFFFKFWMKEVLM